MLAFTNDCDGRCKADAGNLIHVYVGSTTGDRMRALISAPIYSCRLSHGGKVYHTPRVTSSDGFSVHCPVPAITPSPLPEWDYAVALLEGDSETPLPYIRGGDGPLAMKAVGPSISAPAQYSFLDSLDGIYHFSAEILDGDSPGDVLNVTISEAPGGLLASLGATFQIKIAGSQYSFFIGGLTEPELDGISPADEITTVTITAQDEHGGLATADVVLDLATKRDGSVARKATTPALLRSYGVTTNAEYWIKGGEFDFKAFIHFDKVNGKDMILMAEWSGVGGSMPIVGTDKLGCALPFRGFYYESNHGNRFGIYGTREAVPWRKYQQTQITDVSTGEGGSSAGYRLFLGNTGGHGFYNTGQLPCNWGNAANGLGAGFDGSCGNYPGALRFGVGNSGNPHYSVYGGSVKSWVWIDNAV